MPHMPAKVILDIITGDKVSQIQGQSEVTGPAADVIIVNPNGFILKNSTFINVKSLTLVSGWLNHKHNIDIR